MLRNPAQNPTPSTLLDYSQAPTQQVTLSGHRSLVHALIGLTNGMLASGSWDSTIKLWDVNTGQCLKTLEHSGDVNALAELADGTLASGSGDASIKLWDVNTGKCLQTLKGAYGGVHALAVLSDGTLVSGDYKHIKLWDVNTGKCLRTLSGHDRDVKALAVLSNGMLASGSSDGTIKLWDANLGKCLRTLSDDWINALAVLSNGTLVSGSSEDIKLWDVSTGQCLKTLGCSGTSVLAVLSDGTLASMHTNIILLWDVSTGKRLQMLNGNNKGMSSLTALAVLTNGILASGSSDKTIQLWQFPALKLTQQAQADAALPAIIKQEIPAISQPMSSQSSLDYSQAPTRQQTLNGHSDWVNGFAVLTNGTLASGSHDKTIKLWDVNTGQCLQTLSGHSSSIDALAVLTNGTLASGADDKTIKLWDVKTGQCLQTLSGHSNYVNALAELADGTLASGSADSTIKLWDVKTGRCLQTLSGHSDWVNDLAELTNGLLASGSHDKTIKLWDVKTGQCLQTLNGHSTYVFALAKLTNDILASGSFDKTIKLWDVKTGQCLQTLSGHSGNINAVAKLANGTLVSGSRDKTIKLWQFPALKLTQQAQAVAAPSSIGKPEIPAISQPMSNPSSPTTTTSAVNAISQPLANLQPSFHIASSELDWDKNNPLGEGGFGIVYRGTYRYADVAIKQLKTTKLSSEAEKEFQHEVEIMANLRSQQIVLLQGVCLEQKPYLMVMEYMPKGSLYNVLHSDAPLSWDLRVKMGRDVILGLGFLHKASIVHCDLKSLNVLLDEHYNAKLSDFGLSKVKTEVSSTSTQSKPSGTIAWMAPELFKMKAKATPQTDIYSYGMVLWELVSRQIPYESARGDASLIRLWSSQEEHDEIPEECPAKVSHLIKWCWKAKPEERPTTEQAIQLIKEAQPIMASATSTSSTSGPSSGPQYRDATQTSSPSSSPTSGPVYRNESSPGYRR